MNWHDEKERPIYAEIDRVTAQKVAAMSEPNREAAEAACKAVRDALWENPALTFVGQSFGERGADRTKAINQITEAALTAALPHLIAAEREACAKVAEEMPGYMQPRDAAAAIRARKP